MSFYTVFEVAETVVTSTTTANLMAASDPVLIHSSALKKKGQSTVGSIASLWSVSTSSSTGTNLPPFGVIEVTTPTSVQWFLSTATQVGQCVQIFYNSTSTSSASNITSASTANMTFASTETANGMTWTFNQVGRAYLELTAMNTGNSVTNTQWVCTGRSAAGLLCT